MKKLICEDDIKALVKQGKSKLCVTADTILTSAAADAARAAKVDVCVGEPECCPTPADAECDGDITSDQICAALKTMLSKAAPELPYEAECEGGLKLVRGKSVKMEPLDTGNPDATSRAQEVIGESDGSHMGSGFLEIDSSSFEWVMEGYEEIDYVISGTLTVAINGKTFTAHPGDVFLVPAGAKVVWGSPDNAKVFYATYTC